MPVLTGSLSDVGLGHLGSAAPRLKFALNTPAVGINGQLVVTAPVYVTPSAVTGEFTVTLITTDDLRPAGPVPEVFIYVFAEWLGGGFDHFLAPLRVTASTTSIGQAIQAAGSSGLSWTGLQPPPSVNRFTSWLVMDPDRPDDPTVVPTYPGTLLGDYIEWI
jgi:hypothetical protein